MAAPIGAPIGASTGSPIGTMNNSLHLDIISLSRPTFSGLVSSITVPGSEGELTILPHHIPLITPLKAGEVVIRNVVKEGKMTIGETEKETRMAISSGFLIVEQGKVTLMADSAEALEELDEKKIQEAKERAEKLLSSKSFTDDRALADATASLEKSMAHLRIIKKHRTHHKGSAPSAE